MSTSNNANVSTLPMCAHGTRGSRRLVGALRMQPGLISFQLQLGLRGGTAGASANLRGAEQAPFLLSRLADATALWVGVVGGALGEPAVAKAAAAAACGADGGLAAVHVQSRAAAVGGVPAIAAQVGIAGRADGAAAGADWTAAGTGIAAAGADSTATGTGITAAGAGIGAARADWTATGAGIAIAGAGSIGDGTGRCSCVARHWRRRGRIHALKQGACKAWFPAPPDALLRHCPPQPHLCPILKAPLLLAVLLRGLCHWPWRVSPRAYPGRQWSCCRSVLAATQAESAVLCFCSWRRSCCRQSCCRPRLADR